jgi:hypothetical protein
MKKKQKPKDMIQQLLLIVANNPHINHNDFQRELLNLVFASIELGRMQARIGISEKPTKASHNPNL